MTLNSCVKCFCTEQIVEEQQQGIHTAQLNTNCVPGKNINIHLKRTLAESSDPSSHMSYAGLLSPPNIIFANNQFLWQKNASHLKKCRLTSGTKRAAADRGTHAPHEAVLSLMSRLGFARQFHVEYVHFEADLLLPIMQHLSKTNPRTYCTKAESNRIYFQVKINLSITN